MEHHLTHGGLQSCDIIRLSDDWRRAETHGLLQNAVHQSMTM